MVFIDEKGRFFGKINIIDFMVFVLLICSIIAIIKFSHTEISNELFPYRMNIQIMNNPECFIHNIKENDVEIYEGKIRATVEKIKIKEPYELQENKIIVKNSEKNIILQIFIWLKLKDGKLIYTNGQEINENGNFILNINNTIINGKVLNYKRE